jgi:hypothetical protein
MYVLNGFNQISGRILFYENWTRGLLCSLQHFLEKNGGMPANCLPLLTQILKLLLIRKADADIAIIQESGGTQGADIAAAALTITSGRERVVNFLKPFQHLGIAAVTRRSPAGDEKPFTFGVFQPLEPSLWGLILLSMCAVSTSTRYLQRFRRSRAKILHMAKLTSKCLCTSGNVVCC